MLGTLRRRRRRRRRCRRRLFRQVDDDGRVTYRRNEDLVLFAGVVLDPENGRRKPEEI